MSTFLVPLGTDFDNTVSSIVFRIVSIANEMCLNIAIIDEDRVEYNETFSITLTVDNPLDTINGGSTAQANVTIVDNDGELHDCK